MILSSLAAQRLLGVPWATWWDGMPAMILDHQMTLMRTAAGGAERKGAAKTARGDYLSEYAAIAAELKNR